jgi:hypothetical protein
MLAKLLAVQVDVGQVVGGAKIEKEPSVRPGRPVVKAPPVPDGSLLVKELLILRIPVAGNIELLASVKIVLDEICLILRLPVQEIAPGRMRRYIIWLAPIVVVPGLVGVDNDVPLPIQIQTTSGIGIEHG